MWWALLLLMHQCLLRGGEPGALPRDTFRPALGLCWIHIVWLDPTSLQHATARDRFSGLLHWILTVKVRSIKDTLGKLKRVPIPIASKHPTSTTLMALPLPTTRSPTASSASTKLCATTTTSRARCSSRVATPGPSPRTRS